MSWPNLIAHYTLDKPLLKWNHIVDLCSNCYTTLKTTLCHIGHQHGPHMQLGDWDVPWVQTVHDNSLIVVISIVNDTCNGICYCCVSCFSVSNVVCGHLNISFTQCNPEVRSCGFKGVMNRLVASIALPFPLPTKMLPLCPECAGNFTICPHHLGMHPS